MVITPKSATYRAVPLGSKRAATGRSGPPPMREAGPFTPPLLTAKSLMMPLLTSTRTTVNPTGARVFPVTGAWSPNWATKACPTKPKAGLREKSKPFDEECTPEDGSWLWRCIRGRGQ
jgi:hypothetical protein